MEIGLLVAICTGYPWLHLRRDRPSDRRDVKAEMTTISTLECEDHAKGEALGFECLTPYCP